MNTIKFGNRIPYFEKILSKQNVKIVQKLFKMFKTQRNSLSHYLRFSCVKNNNCTSNDKKTNTNKEE